jgi:nicotinate-nucleotide pyrophosphorylase (carboxylating)
MQRSEDIDRLLTLALAEDVGQGDLTTEACITEEMRATGTFYAKQKGVVAGLPFLAPLFHKLDPRLEIELLVPESSFQSTGAALVLIKGPARALMSGERCALNLLQHVSGVATVTAEYVKKVAGLQCAILDTRKTLPGLRTLEKYAVCIAGGVNHRFGLDDRFIIKANHLAFLGSSNSQAIAEAVAALRTKAPHIPIEIEVNSLKLCEKALFAGADAVMLYGMTPAEVKTCTQKAHASGKKAFFETAVALPMDSILAFARTGIDGIAIGALTTATQPFDISMRLQPTLGASPTAAPTKSAHHDAKGLSHSHL